MPVGSGPYKVSSISRDSSGVPIEYDMSAFDEIFSRRAVYRFGIVLKSSPTRAKRFRRFEGRRRRCAMANIDPSTMPIELKGMKTLVSPFTRIFGLFFNQNQNAIFADKAIRVALDESAPKQEIVKNVLDGYGVPLDGPLTTSLDTATDSASFALASSTLSKDGWKNINGTLEKTSKKTSTPLSFSVSTGDISDLSATADILKDAWGSLGAQVDVKVFNQSDLAQTVVETRNYDALLLGMVLGDHPDLYAFWASSQRNYPGLNVAEYVNVKADKVLSDMRQTSNVAAQTKDEQQFLSYVASDTPAVFLYSPDFIYAVPSDIKNISLGPITVSADRFENIWQWYIDTDRVWSVFVQK